MKSNIDFAYLKECLIQHDLVILCIDADGITKNLTDLLSDRILRAHIDRKILILSRNAKEQSGDYFEIKMIDDKMENDLLDLYGTYDFSDKFLVLANIDNYGTVFNYVETGVLTLDEAFDAILY